MASSYFSKFACRLQLKMKANYHTHTTRCQHAHGSDESYIQSAIRSGYNELGFSDHTPWKYASEYKSDIRMYVNQLSGYVQSIRALKEKYKNQISIKVGLECEYFETYIPWLKDIICKEKLDYILFGNHFYRTDEQFPYFGKNTSTPEILALYEESALKGMESGIFNCLAHPDLFARSYPSFDKHCEQVSRRICKKAHQLYIPLEYNLSGFAICKEKEGGGYPHPQFWQIAADEKCQVIIGVDAHSNRQLEDITAYEKAIRFLNSLSIKRVETIPFIKHN